MLLKTWISPQLGIVFNLSITHTIRNYSFLPIIINNYSHHNLASLHSSKLSLFSFQGAIEVFDEILLFVRSDCISIHREGKK